jgi:putative addiction module component (TIGR02574 family)
MTVAKLQKIRAEALELPESERATLVYDLLASLDGPPDADAEQAWEREISRRLDEVESGKAESISSDEVIAKIRQQLGAGKK